MNIWKDATPTAGSYLNSITDAMTNLRGLLREGLSEEAQREIYDALKRTDETLWAVFDEATAGE